MLVFHRFGTPPSYLLLRNTARSLTQSIAEGLLKPSISLGVGLIHRFDPIRVELNCGVPLVASASDRTRRGLQVGMGLEFL